MSQILNFVAIFGGAAAIVASQFFFPKDESKERQIFISPPPHLESFSFGFQFPIADNMWIRAIQDIDHCESAVEKNRCRSHDWLYQMLDSITNLAPDHLLVYTEGGVALSVLLSDVSGAAKIYQKGLAIFPNHFQLHYRAAAHAFAEEKNNVKAAGLFLKAARIEGLEGSWLYSLATRLYTDAGQKEVARRIYNDMKEQGLSEEILQRMGEKLGIQDGQ